MALRENRKAGARRLKLETMLAELKREYVASMPSRIQVIRENFSKGDTPMMKDDFHRLKGSGKTYGVPEISLVAEVGETICRDKAKDVAAAVPVLLDLLTEIHAKQSRQESFDVGRDPRF